MIRNVLTRRREYSTYLATACRHRRRLKMQKRDQLMKAAVPAESYVIHLSSASLVSCDVYGQQPGRCRTLSSLLIHFLSLYKLGSIQRLEDIRKHIPKGIMPATHLKGSPLHVRPNQTKAALYCTRGWGREKAVLLVLGQ